MIYGLDQRKIYRFPSQASILDYEIDHHIYFPSKESIPTKETNTYKEDVFSTRQSYGNQKGELS